MMRRALSSALCIAALVVGCQQPGRPTVSSSPPPTDLTTKDSAKLCLKAAQSFEAQGYDTEAIAQYERALQFDPQAASTASRRLGVLYARRNDPSRAAAAYQTALRLTPNDAALLNDVGYFALDQGNAPAAEQSLRKALAIDPKLDRAWVNLGLALAAEDRVDDSYSAFAKALPPAQARSNVGIALARRGRYAEAAGSLAQALALDPSMQPTRAALEWVQARLRSTTAPTTSP